jgi:hypothetical protein
MRRGVLYAGNRAYGCQEPRGVPLIERRSLIRLSYASHVERRCLAPRPPTRLIRPPMNLLSRHRTRLIAAQVVVVAGLCVALYIAFLRPSSSEPLSGAGVPGQPRADVTSRGIWRHTKPHGGHRARRGSGNYGPAAPSGTGASSSSQPLTSPQGAIETPSGPGAQNPPPANNPGGSQYSSSVSALQAKLGLSPRAP